MSQSRLYLSKDVKYLYEYDENGIPSISVKLPRNVKDFRLSNTDLNFFVMFCDVLEYNKDRENFKVRIYLEDEETVEGWTPQGLDVFGIANPEYLFVSGILNRKQVPD